MHDKTATRRGFFLKAGAAISAPAAVAVGAAPPSESDANLESRIAELEDSAALRRLTAEFIGLVNSGNESRGLLRTAVAEILPEEFDTHALIDVSVDRRSASIKLPCAVGVDEPIEAPESVLVTMARLQGEGYVRRARSRLLRLSCVRENSGWTVTRAQLEDAV